MERFTEKTLVLKSFPYQERDRIIVGLTETRGKITALAKGGINSRRYGGALDFLACSQIHFLQKPHVELARIEEAHTFYELKNLARDFRQFTTASFAAELCIQLLEPHAPSRDVFITLSNMLVRLDEGMEPRLLLNAFLCKIFKALGYPPSLLRCIQCSRGAHEIRQFFWSSTGGGMICNDCTSNERTIIEGKTLLYFQQLLTTPFKELRWSETDPYLELYQMLSDFLHHHLPGTPNKGFKSWKLLNEVMI